MIGRILKYLFIFGFVVGLVAAAAAGVVGLYFYVRITRDLPRIERLSDYRPKAVSQLLADDGTVIAKYWDEYRVPVKFEDIPQQVKDAFLAAEDANFYKHQGIDLTSIVRAIWKNFRHHSTKQGASTITQQIVKSLLLSREKTYERKIKEAILSYQIEKSLTKDEIFSVYLNEIFLGSNAYGVKAAAWMHFRKDLSQLSLAETAFLAGLPPRPSYLTNPANRKDAEERRSYVLGQMYEHGMITRKEKEEAESTQLQIYPPDMKVVYQTPYYATQSLQDAEDILRGIDPSLSVGNPGGYTIQTEVNVKAYNLAERSLQRGLRELDKRRGWRGPIGKLEDKPEDAQLQEKSKNLEAGEIYKAEIIEINPKTMMAKVRVGDFSGSFSIKDATWANRFLNPHDETSAIDLLKAFKPGYVVEVSLDIPKDNKGPIAPLTDITKEAQFKLDQTPDVEGAFTLLNPLTGQVKVIIGGYDFNRSKFNRATQGERQPGSSFKPLIYTSAVEFLNYTPSTLVPDSPISLVAGNGKLWTPQNFDHEYLGPITLRTALQKSRNVVSVYLLQRVGIDRVIGMARKFGLTTKIGRDMSISLGSADVKPIEMTSAYGVFAAGGWLADRITVSKIVDRDGKVVFEKKPNQTRVIPEDTAFIMANMMKGVVERGTATVVKQLNRPVAGKTGTTNDQMDAWFIGYTPEWVSAVWVGFDQKKQIGNKETGGKVAAPIFVYFMQDFLANTMPLDFQIPDGVVPVPVDLSSGHYSESPDAFIEYFKAGTEPNSASAPDTRVPNDYLQNDEF